MASIQSFIVRQISRQYMKTVTPDRDVHELRSGFEKRMRILPSARGVSICKESIDGVDCELHVPKGCEDAPLIYYLHGGAYVMGSPTTHRRFLSFIAREAGMRAVLPDYRLAPEFRFPSQLEDSLQVWRALLKGGISQDEIAIGGDSAGGNLAMATLLSLRDAGEPMPAACFLLSPLLDLFGEGDSYSTRSKLDPWFRPEYLPNIADMFCNEDERRNPIVSPVNADASGLPRTFIQVGDHELLLDDSTRLAENIRAAGGQVDLHIWPKMWHVFQIFIGQMPESKKAVEDIARFLRSEVLVDRAGAEESCVCR